MNQHELPDQQRPVVTRTDVIARIEARLAGRLTDAALAAWAFDRFYAWEVEEEEFEPGAEVAIAGVLDELMFGDHPAFHPDEKDLRGLIGQLSEV